MDSENLTWSLYVLIIMWPVGCFLLYKLMSWINKEVMSNAMDHSYLTAVTIVHNLNNNPISDKDAI